MKREPNITRIYLDKYKRTFFSNPVFNPLSTELDNIFKEKGISDKYVIENFYVDSEDNRQILDCITQKFNQEQGSVYFLLGKKGIGKTIFLKNYIYEMRKGRKYNISGNDIVVYLDLKTKKTNKNFLNSLPSSLFSEIFFELKKDEKIYQYLTNPVNIRELDISYKNMNDDTLAQRVLNKKDEAVQFLFGWGDRNKYGIILILDNLDDFPVVYVKSIIDKCTELANEFSVHCIIALRDYWYPRRQLGIDDRQTCSSCLSAPNIYEIIRKRLKSVSTRNITSEIQIKYADKIIKLDAADIIKTFETISRNLIDLSKELHDELYQLANHNTREHLLNIFYFFHSPYLFSKPNFISALVEKLKEVDPDFEEENARPIKFFDFIENLMAIHYLFYDTQTSQIFNLFYHDWEYEKGLDYKNTLIYIRILQIAPRDGTLISKEHIVHQLKEISYEEEATLDAINNLLDKALLESQDGVKVEDVDNLRLSIKGELYLSKLIYEYSYLLFVCDAVPMPDTYKVDLIQKFGDEKIPLERGNLRKKHESVNAFVDFIKFEEQAEETKCCLPKRSVLSSIKGNENISKIMGDSISEVIEKMIIQKKSRVQKIQDVQVVIKR